MFEIMDLIYALFEAMIPLMIFILLFHLVIKFIIIYSKYDNRSSKYNEREKKLKAYEGYEDMWLLKECMYIANKSNSKKIAFLAGLFEDDPKIFNPLMIKYRETFKVILQVLVAAKKESLENDASVVNKINELLVFPTEDFSKLKKIRDSNIELERDMELKALNLTLEDELKILKEIRKIYQTTE